MDLFHLARYLYIQHYGTGSAVEYTVCVFMFRSSYSSLVL